MYTSSNVHVKPAWRRALTSVLALWILYFITLMSRGGKVYRCSILGCYGCSWQWNTHPLQILNRCQACSWSVLVQQVALRQKPCRAVESQCQVNKFISSLVLMVYYHMGELCVCTRLYAWLCVPVSHVYAWGCVYARGCMQEAVCMHGPRNQWTTWSQTWVVSALT